LVRLAHALGSPGVVCFLYAVLMSLPMVNLAVILIMSMRATRTAGYRVGLLGAKSSEGARKVPARTEPILPRD
jgi:hypothetical protein